MSAQESCDGACTTPETSDNGGNSRAKKVLIAVNNLTHAVRRKSLPIPTGHQIKKVMGRKVLYIGISENQAPFKICPRLSKVE